MRIAPRIKVGRSWSGLLQSMNEKSAHGFTMYAFVVPPGSTINFCAGFPRLKRKLRSQKAPESNGNFQALCNSDYCVWLKLKLDTVCLLYQSSFQNATTKIQPVYVMLINSAGDRILGVSKPDSQKSLSPVRRTSAFASIAALKIGRSSASLTCDSDMLSSVGMGTSSSVSKAVERNLLRAAKRLGNFLLNILLISSTFCSQINPRLG